MQTCKVVVFSMRQLEFETEAIAPSPAARHGVESTCTYQQYYVIVHIPQVKGCV